MKKKFVSLHNEGKTNTEIAEITGYHRVTVGKHLIELVGYQIEPKNWKEFRLQLERDRKAKE